MAQNHVIKMIKCRIAHVVRASPVVDENREAVPRRGVLALAELFLKALLRLNSLKFLYELVELGGVDGPVCSRKRRHVVGINRQNERRLGRRQEALDVSGRFRTVFLFGIIFSLECRYRQKNFVRELQERSELVVAEVSRNIQIAVVVLVKGGMKRLKTLEFIENREKCRQIDNALRVAKAFVSHAHKRKELFKASHVHGSKTEPQ